MLKLAGRYYRTIPMDRAGYVEETLELDPARTALVALHCWNIGCEDGPAIDNNYWVGMGFPETMIEAGRIMSEVIRPAMDAARRAGIAVAHVEGDSIARQHPEALEELDPPAPAGGGGGNPPTAPGWMGEMVARHHGKEYWVDGPSARMDRAAVVAPQAGEIYAFQSGQLDRLLRRRGIENLIYTGFATDMCILRAPGGIEPMAGCGYRIHLVRDATIGVECPDTFEERIATRWAIRYFETHYGGTITSADFIRACAALAR